MNHDGGVIVNVLSAVYRGFKFRSLWVKPKNIKLVFAAFPLCRQYSCARGKTGWLGIRITCCFIEPGIWRSNSAFGLVQNKHYHHFIECNTFSPWYSWQIVYLALCNTHSLIIMWRRLFICIKTSIWICHVNIFMFSS
jgi:hypothetical protein